MTKIEELKNLSHQQRIANLERTFQKNRRFFQTKYPAVGKLIRPGGAAPYHIAVTDDFLEIEHTQTKELCHPEIGLDKFAAALGDWTNQAWIDLIEGAVQLHNDHGAYSQFPRRLQEAVLNRFPGLYERMKKRRINLPTLPNGKRFSNSVVFAGIFHGLHIDYYLSRTQLSNAAFIEPEVNRFVLSCYFLDYQRLDEHFGGLILHIGDDFPHSHINRFLTNAQNTAPVWVRVLPGYASDKVEPLMRQFRLKWRHLYDVWVPAENMLKELDNAAYNIAAGANIYAEIVSLSDKSRIAVGGSGPSLSEDLPWLKEHQNQFIIFAAHSSVSALQQAGIKPDFQFNIETFHWEKETYERLNLDTAIPIVTPIGTLPDKFADFDQVFMLPETNSMLPVNISKTIPFLSPTTGNTAIGFACNCAPTQVCLFGFDFGFREATKTHVKESSAYQDEAAHQKQLGSSNVQVPANFPEASTVYTQSYFNLARLYAEYAIGLARKNKTQVFNCSDGARIAGAEPYRSSDIPAWDYDKSTDIEKIRSMFRPLQEKVDWQCLPLDGATQLEEYKKAMQRELKMTRFNWLEFTRTIDNFRANVEKQLPRYVAKHKDNRINPYMNVVNELLVSWYRMLCFTNTEEEWQHVYDEGYKVVCGLIDEMTWEVGEQTLSTQAEEKAEK
ncbi:MAG: 6-hydroxymethylpterin diphosphokinase MptE-like protein [Porticoccaceae bacterium]